jgi:pyruvate,water dikinase
MVHADEGASGVMFTLDTESGFDDVILINASYGLGEAVVQGEVVPDEFYVHKKTLGKVKNSILSRTLGNKKYKATYSHINEVDKTLILVPIYEELQNVFSVSDEEVLELARYGLLIEEHYQKPMDIEWAKDGIDGKIYILQARPETVVSALQKSNTLTRYTLTSSSKVLAEGRAVGQKISTGKICILNNPSEMDHFKDGDILSTDITDPNWEPIMKKASAILTKRGGRTCHAAIVARELGISAVVGCGESLNLLHEGQSVTVSCAEGDMGHVYEGILDFTVEEITLDSMPPCPVKIAMNVGNPHLAYRFQSTPNTGIGLARLEFIINSMIGIHPMAAHNFPNLPKDLKMQLREKSHGYASPKDFFVEKMAEGISTLAAAFWPKPVIVRLSDFKSNEYRNLIGGELYEPLEENPMIGWRGASRYISPDFKDCFAMECEALKIARNDKGLKNVEIMIPFVRTVSELQTVIQELESHNLKRGVDGLRIIMMCEIPSNALLADQFLEHIDGFSIGSNDMTQLTLGVDRDSGLMQHSFDERDEAVKVMLKMAIQACRKANKYVGICGQGPSDYPELAKWLTIEGIESISLNPDTVIDTWLFLANFKNTNKKKI